MGSPYRTRVRQRQRVERFLHVSFVLRAFPHFLRALRCETRRCHRTKCAKLTKTLLHKNMDCQIDTLENKLLDALESDDGQGPAVTGSTTHVATTKYQQRRWVSDNVHRDLIKGADMVSSIMIAVCWCYLVPYAAIPDGGCPSMNPGPCWHYAGYLFLWIVAATLLLPLVSVWLQSRLTKISQTLGREGSVIRKGYIAQSQRLFVGSLGTVWSIANSSFITAIVEQGALTGLSRPGQLDPQEEGDTEAAVTAAQVPSAQNQSSRAESARAILFSSGLALAYFTAAVVSIVGVSGVCEITVWCEISPSAYVVELALLLQKNWYYAVGYSSFMICSYIWFSSLGGSSYFDAWITMLLSCVRAVTFAFAFRGIALRLLAFQPEEDPLPSSGTRAKLRLLLFRGAAVVAVCAIADVPYSFATYFLPTIAGIGEDGQILVLLAFSLWGFVALPRWDSELALVEPPTKASLYDREIAQWLLAFLIWFPWQLVLNILTATVHDSVQDHSGIVVFLTLLSFGTAVTAVVAFLNCLVHSGRGAVLQSAGRYFAILIPPLRAKYHYQKEDSAGELADTAAEVESTGSL